MLNESIEGEVGARNQIENKERAQEGQNAEGIEERTVALEIQGIVNALKTTNI